MHPQRRNFLRFIFLISIEFSPLVRAQTSTPAENSILPGPQPQDVPPDWKNLVGVYGHKNAQITILEKGGRLLLTAPFMSISTESAVAVQDYHGREFIFTKGVGVQFKANTLLNSDGHITGLVVFRVSRKGSESTDNSRRAYEMDSRLYFPRADAGADPTHFYQVIPATPVGELREKALKMAPPEEVGPFRRPDLVDLVPLDPAIHLDIRYAGANNFLSTPVYREARAFLERPAAEALVRALDKLQPLGYGLLIHDAYRPWYVTKIFWDATPSEGKIFVADPKIGSKHNRGCAVDLTLYDLQTGKAVEMPGLYGEMSPRSFPDYPGGTSLERWHRDLLRRAMESEGFTVNEDEWWHFDYKDWNQYPILNMPFEKLTTSQ